MTKPQEFRDCSLDELKAKENDFRKELFTMKNQTQHEKKQPHLIRQMRKDIARLKTIIGEK